MIRTVIVGRVKPANKPIPVGLTHPTTVELGPPDRFQNKKYRWAIGSSLAGSEPTFLPSTNTS